MHRPVSEDVLKSLTEALRKTNEAVRKMFDSPEFKQAIQSLRDAGEAFRKSLEKNN